MKGLAKSCPDNALYLSSVEGGLIIISIVNSQLTKSLLVGKADYSMCISPEKDILSKELQISNATKIWGFLQQNVDRIEYSTLNNCQSLQNLSNTFLLG